MRIFTYYLLALLLIPERGFVSGYIETRTLKRPNSPPIDDSKAKSARKQIETKEVSHRPDSQPGTSSDVKPAQSKAGKTQTSQPIAKAKSKDVEKPGSQGIERAVGRQSSSTVTRSQTARNRRARANDALRLVREHQIRRAKTSLEKTRSALHGRGSIRHRIYDPLTKQDIGEDQRREDENADLMSQQLQRDAEMHYQDYKEAKDTATRLGNAGIRRI